MKRYISTAFFLACYSTGFAQNEVKPDGDKLLAFFAGIILLTILFFVFRKKDNKRGRPILPRRRLEITLEKDRVYFPDYLELAVTNKGNVDIDLDKPLLVLDNFWLKRKFRLKGMQNRNFYPLFLEKGKTHRLTIDLNGFYRHDKKLKRYPKATVRLFDVKGRRLGSKTVYLRKSLVKF